VEPEASPSRETVELPAPFGKYELLERIATGGMAEVFLARSFGVAGFEKRLVIKRIRSEFAQDPRFVSMFINEAKISVHLNHPNVVQLYDLGKVGATWYIAMEHLHGRDLNRVVKAMRASGERWAHPMGVAVVAEACRGLAYAHGRTDAQGNVLGLVHRDVSPHNLIVTFAGEVKLVDFGIARLMSTVTGRAEGLAAPGRPGGGKYAYMSPEQARGEEVDHRTDIFSAGIVLWELLVGHRLFQGPDPAEKLRRVQEAVVPHPRDEGVPIDDDLWDILEKALARERAERYPNAALLEEDLRAWLFQKGERVGRAEISAVMRTAFPGEADRLSADLDLQKMVADVEQLDAATSATTTHGTGTATPTEALPGRLRTAEGERKRVAVLVVDVDGLTSLSERLEPEVLFKHHLQLLRWMRGIVDRYDGTLQRAVDDQVMVLFGVPRTHADDAARALECALELQRRSSEIEEKGFHVDLAVGVHLGEVTVALGGRHVRYEARGNTTRLARRLSSVADHGQVLASERVLRAAGADFKLRRGPDVANRGGRPAEPSYVVEGRRRGVRGSGKGPWMRRGAELDVIRDALVELANGKGSVIALIGREGTGKSRLVREIRDLALKRAIPMFTGRCTPFGEDGADPFVDVVREVLGADAELGRDDLKALLERLPQLGLSRRDVDAIGGLLGVGEQPLAARTATAPLQDDDDVWQALGRMLAGLSADGAVILGLEDVHHLAPRHHGRLRRLVQAVSTRPVMLLTTARGSVEALKGLAHEVELGPFPAAAQQRLVRALLDVEDVDPELGALLERTCEGNPLYLEEMAKFLLDNGQVVITDGVARLVGPVDEPALPDNLAALLAARIDQLDPGSKGALQLAAVIGPTFSGALLGEAAGIEDPTPIITDLAAHGLVVRSPGGGDQWAFSSELVREATLRGVLGVQRRDYHRLVAAAIESLHAAEKDGWAEALAAHCAAGGRPLDAARYAHKAGEALERSHSLERAREQYERGLQWIREVPERPDTWDARVQGEATLALRLGIVSLLQGDTRKGEKSLQLALDIAGDAGIPWVEVRAHLELGRSYLQRGRTELAGAHLAQARELLELEDDPELTIEALEANAVLAYELGKSAEAVELWQQALRRAGGNPRATARCLVGLANRHLRSGAYDEAAPLLDRALEAARGANDRILEGRVLNNIGLLHSGATRFDDALAYFRKALEVREGIGYTRGVVVNHHNIGDVHFARADWARAHVAFSRSRELAAEIGWQRGTVINDVYLGYLEAMQGEPAGLEKVRKATEEARALGDADSLTTGAWLLGRLLLDQGRTEEARKHLQQALADANKFDLRPMARSIEELLAAIPV
jgi:serine/threonine protein kinase/class 3 adenylate cyclase/tetratricopeptide (TPR) repeat protein